MSIGGTGLGRQSGAAAVPVAEDAWQTLPEAGFADSFRIALPQGGSWTAPQVMDGIFAASPAWVGRLMALRDRAVAPFGLRKAAGQAFPVVSAAPERVVLGFDDRHLNFRILCVLENGFAVVTTLVKTHNMLGRAYLAAIMPFHKMVVRAMLEAWAERPAVAGP